MGNFDALGEGDVPLEPEFSTVRNGKKLPKDLVCTVTYNVRSHISLEILYKRFYIQGRYISPEFKNPSPLSIYFYLGKSSKFRVSLFLMWS